MGTSTLPLKGEVLQGDISTETCAESSERLRFFLSSAVADGVPVVVRIPAFDEVNGRLRPVVREWHVPTGIVTAELHFLQLLPELTACGNLGRWALVAADGQCQVFDTEDDADRAARARGLDETNYIVRYLDVDIVDSMG
jgi:hypothetical protein